MRIFLSTNNSYYLKKHVSAKHSPNGCKPHEFSPHLRIVVTYDFGMMERSWKIDGKVRQKFQANKK